MKEARRTLAVAAALLLLAAAVPGAYANQRSLADARQIAQRWLSDPVVAEAPALAPAARTLSGDSTGTGTTLVPYYIFGDGQGRGFAIISGTDRMRPVIGYSQSTAYEAEQMPDNFRLWLESIGQAAAYLESHPEVTTAAMAADATFTPVAPLLGNIEWGQDEPYNRLCPSAGDGHCMTGCVATALAQLLYYHRYPTRGTGSKTYNGGPYASSISLNFSQQTYDYSLMFDQYDPDGDYSPAQLGEVAKLCYHAGVAVSMQYGKEASSAAISYVHNSLINYFGYDKLAQVLNRSHYTYDEWQEILHAELTHSRPVVYGATDQSEGGHCFVIDGIDASGLYHVNWGWDGLHDGYYDISFLDPATFEFCLRQSALVQAAPAGQIADRHYYGRVRSDDGPCFSIAQSAVKCGKEVEISASSLHHLQDKPFVGYLGLAFVSSGEVKAVSMYNDTLSIVNGYYSDLSELPIRIPTSLGAGSYRVYLVAKEYGGAMSDSIAIVHGLSDQPNYYDCSISRSMAYFTRPSSDVALSVAGWDFGSGTLRAGSSQTFSCRVDNKGESTCSGRFVLRLASPSHDTCWVYSDTYTIPTLSSDTVTFETTFKESGQWTTDLFFWAADFSSNELASVNDSKSNFTVADDPTLTASLVLTGTLQLKPDIDWGDSLFVDVPASFDVPLSNQSGDYNGQLQIQLFKTVHSTAPVATVETSVAIPAGASGTYTVSGTLVQANDSFRPAASGTLCCAKVYYRRGNDFVLMSTATGVDNQISVRVYADDPAETGLAGIVTDAGSATATVYDLMGRPCSPTCPLRPGIYIVDGKKKIIR